MKPTLNNDALPISDEINGILIKYGSALAEITRLNTDNARLQEICIGLENEIAAAHRDVRQPIAYEKNKTTSRPND